MTVLCEFHTALQVVFESLVWAQPDHNWLFFFTKMKQPQVDHYRPVVIGCVTSYNRLETNSNSTWLLSVAVGSDQLQLL
jgi:hypothetical protein